MADLEEIVARAVKGEESAWEYIVRTFSRRIYNMAFQFTMNSADAEDLTQEIFIKLYSSLRKFLPGSNFKLWFYRLAKNFIIDWYRKNKQISMRMEELKRDFENRSSGNDLNANLDALKVKLRRAIDSLEEEFKMPLILRDLQGISYEEISKILDLPLGTVKSRINRGRILVTEILRGEK
ncbi:MAG: RNA polymerase sigma factor [Candidatus Aminicenantia bacterium]